jgi:type II secretory pathway pseudopilin PulG
MALVLAGFLAVAGVPPIGPATVAAVEDVEREALEAQQRRIEKHLLRVQRERFEARARGESPATVRRLSREFDRTQQRRMKVIRAMREAEAGR